ncbi:MAG TPA: SRPBCC family protein [Elainellaceae cyanobacterium]
MANWLEHNVQTKVEVPIDLVWSLWSDLEQVPHWMKWIDSIYVLENNPELSQWKLVSGGLEIGWQQKMLRVMPHQIIQWQSVSGLLNRGAVRFCDRCKCSAIKFTVAYATPGILGTLMDNLLLRRIVESTMGADLERFRNYALHMSVESSASSQQAYP